MRRQLLDSYRKSGDSGAPLERRLSKLRQIVEQVLQPGMSVREAERLLMAAGFWVNNDIAHVPSREDVRFSGRAAAVLDMENTNYGIVHLTIVIESVNPTDKLDILGEIKVFLGATAL